MYYYFDKETGQCAHMSSGPLIADQCHEVKDSNVYDDMGALRCELVDGVLVVVEDDKILEKNKLEEAKRSLDQLINFYITRWSDAEEFGKTESERLHAAARSKVWREYRYNVAQATDLPLPKPPKEDNDE